MRGGQSGADLTLEMWLGEGGEERMGGMERSGVEVVGARGNLAPHQHQGSMHFRLQRHGGSGQGRLVSAHILETHLVN